jgi:hypothetical protein
MFSWNRVNGVNAYLFTLRQGENVSLSLIREPHFEFGQLGSLGNGLCVWQVGAPPPEESEKSVFRLEILGAPFIILPFSDFNEIYTSSPVQPVGLALRFSVLPLKTKIGVFGLDLLPS